MLVLVLLVLYSMVCLCFFQGSRGDGKPPQDSMGRSGVKPGIRPSRSTKWNSFSHISRSLGLAGCIRLLGRDRREKSCCAALLGWLHKLAF